MFHRVRDQDGKSSSSFLDRSRLAVIPIDDSLGGIPAADETDFRVRLPHFAGISMNRPAATISTRCAVTSFSISTRSSRLGAVKMLVGIDARHHENHFVHHACGGVGRERDALASPD